MTITEAKQLAHEAHDSIKQVRKYNLGPYWVHTDAVADTSARYTNDTDIIVAAHLHDVIEDVWPLNSYYSIKLITSMFGGRVANMVIELTDVYTYGNYPTLKRSQRKMLEGLRIAKISKESKLIKLADNLDNTDSIVNNDLDFARVYLNEVWANLSDLKEGSPALHGLVEQQILRGMMRLNLPVVKNAS